MTEPESKPSPRIVAKSTGFGVEREDRPPDGQARGPTAFDHHQARLIVLVECNRVPVAHLRVLIQNGALEHQKTVARIHEGMSFPWIGVHHTSNFELLV